MGFSEDFKQEYQTFIKKYIFPLVGFSQEKIDKICENTNIFDYSSQIKYNKYNDLPVFARTIKDEKCLLFGNFRFVLFGYKNVELSNDDMNLVQRVVASYLEITKYKSKQNGSFVLLKSRTSEFDDLAQQYAVEQGIGNWLGDKQICKLIDCLKNWSGRTYEGHNVCYGILINREKNVEGHNFSYGSFLDFLRDEYSAVLSDGITSIIEVDKECNFVGYHSITENNIIPLCNIGFVPYRFASVINQYVFGDRVGLFLLINGDIIIAKNKSIYFIRRNNKWLNFKSESFLNVISALVNNIDDNLLNEIFATVVDVSLSHTGGIVAVVDQGIESITSKLDVLSNYNDSQANNDEMFKNEYEKLTASFDNQDPYYQTKIDKVQKDLNKRMLKRQVVHELIKKDNSTHLNFTKIDRKLRAELIGLDGACIINQKGEILSFGAIIENEAGSSGGGRGAAAKRLSRLGGFAVKISTDGYIEVYVDGNNVYSIK